MGKMHELLAVESDLDAVFKKILHETKIVFSKHQSLFTGSVRVLEMFDSEENDRLGGVKEKTERETTVSEKLDYMKAPVIKYLDCLYQKDLTNKVAVADLIIDGTTLATAVPATYFLTLEKKLKHLREVIDAAPTLEKGVKWVESVADGNNVYESESPKITDKTQKFRNSIIVAQATKEHKAQVEVWDDSKVVGRYKDTYSSGKISSGRKSVLLGKIDKLLLGVKEARMRANSTDIVKGSIGGLLMNFILSE